jgi:RNA polymerase sigma factor (sigma-70 family)
MDKDILVHQLLKELKFGIEQDCIEATEKAITILYPRFAKRFHSYARHQGLTAEDADDSVEDIFERILNGIGSYNEAKAGGEKWLWMICRNIVIDKQRKTLQATELPDDIPSQEADPALIFEKEQHSQALERAWGYISEADRQELRQGKGRGPGRTAWHEAARRFREAFFKEYR